MLKFTEKDHTYTWDGKLVPCVSDILSCVGTRKSTEAAWKSISGGDFSWNDTAARFGTALHRAIAYALQGVKCKYDPALEPWIKGFKKFLTETGFNKLSSAIIEIPMYSKTYGYSGTPDWVVRDGKNFYIIDWKSSTTFMKHWRMQSAAYEQLEKEWQDSTRRYKFHRWSVRIYENGYSIDKRYNHPEDWNRFLAALNLYKVYS